MSKQVSVTPPHRSALAAALSAAWLLLAAPIVQAEFILFPSLTGTEHSGLNPHPDVHHPSHTQKQSELKAELDLFYSADKDRLRLLAEVLVTPDHTSAERLQAGWFATPETTLWIGRHHSPLGYWNTQFHHGTYLQTSIKRPAISGFDDHGGVLPSHLSGLLVEGARTLENDAAIDYAFSFGAATRQTSDGRLTAFDLFDPHSGPHKPGSVLRLGYRPDATATDVAGLFLGYSTIPSALSSVREIRQTIAGAFFNREQGRWRWIGELFGVRNDLDQTTGNARSTFVNANLQGEHEWRRDWTLYGRAENTFGDRSGAYLMHFSGFVKERYLLGVRHELTRNQALKLELSDVHVMGDSYVQFGLQWSAALP